MAQLLGGVDMKFTRRFFLGGVSSLAVSSAVAMTPGQQLILFGGGLPAPPSGFVYLLGADGAFLLGADGAYLLGVYP